MDRVAIVVKVTDKTKGLKLEFFASKRVWSVSDVPDDLCVEGLDTKDLIDRLNYAEDLFVRRDTRVANDPNHELAIKTIRRRVMEFILHQPAEKATELFLTAQSRINDDQWFRDFYDNWRLETSELKSLKA